jgi:tetratricopeptide (TPR) repeat protein
LCPDQLDNLFPYLGRLLLVPLCPEEEARLQSLEGSNLKANTFFAVQTFVRCAADRLPLLLVCEDLHWADPTSIELLERMLSFTDSSPLLFVCVFRPDSQHGSWRLRETSARSYPHRHTDLELSPLSCDDSETLLNNLLQGGPLPPALKERILDLADGNPFYVEEVIRSLIDSGIIAQEDISGRWLAQQDASKVPIPDTLQGVLSARIDRLPEDCKRVLETAAVIGRLFAYRLLAEVALEEDTTPEATPSDLESHLLTLQREQLIRERSRLPELEYIFKHHLTWEVAYSRLLKKERRRKHRQVAEALERSFPERAQEQVEVLAHHWGQAGVPKKAIHYRVLAGERARCLGASLEAISFYEAAVLEMARLQAPGLELELYQTHEGLGDVYLENLSRQDKALEHYEQFLQLSCSTEEQARAARKLAAVYLMQGDLTRARAYFERALISLRGLPHHVETSRAHYGLAQLLSVYLGQVEEAKQHALASLEISQGLGDTRGLADAHRVLGIIASQRSEAESARLHDEQSLELYRQAGDLPRTALACNNLGESYRLMGHMDQAMERLQEGLEIARRIGDTRDEALLLQTTGELSLDQGEWEAAVRHGEQSVARAEQSGAVNRIIEAHSVLAAACEAAGRLDEARQHLRTAEKWALDTQMRRFAPPIYLRLAHLCATEGDSSEARRWAELAQQAAGPEPESILLGRQHACLAYLHSCDGNPELAVQHAEKSLPLLERAGLLAELAQARLSLAVAYLSHDAPAARENAREQLQLAASFFRQIGAHGYLKEVEQRLDELAQRLVI